MSSGALEEFNDVFEKFVETYNNCRSLSETGNKFEMTDQNMVSGS
jgi:hypothetical protein